MCGAVFFDGPDLKRKLSRFWILLILASVIAAAGVVGDSTATVIGAMIVAPLMTPIPGWEVLEVSTTAYTVDVRVIGSPPIPETDSYRDALVAGGIDPDGIVIEFIPCAVVALGGSDDEGFVPD